MLVTHRRDDFLHVPRRGGDTGLRFDVIEARDLEFPREVVPLLVIAGDQLAAEGHALLEPPAEVIHERGALILLRAKERQQLALAIEIGQRLTAKQLYQLVPEQRAVDSILEVLLARGEVIGVLG